MASVPGNTDRVPSISEEGTTMEVSTSERLEQIRQRLTEARETQKEVLLRLAETEDRVAATFDRLAHGGSHAERRAELARQARDQAAHLRAYVSRADGRPPQERTIISPPRRRATP
jgi:hypothetical protein